MGNVIVAGGSVQLDGGTNITINAGVPYPVTLIVNSSNKLQGDSKTALVKSDMESQTPVASIAYFSTTFPTPGTVSWDGKLNGSQASAKLLKDSNGVSVDDTSSGSVTFTVVTPAQNPSVATDVPGTQYTGNWNLTTSGQNKLTTTE